MMQPNLQKPLPKQLIFNISAIIILCCVGAIIYSNALHTPFQFDDKSFNENSSTIKSLSNIGAIWNYWASRFITFFTFAINYHFDQLHVFGYHLVNLIIHLGSSLTAFWLITLLLSAPEMKKDKIAKHANLMAFLGALIFLSHPIQTESVTYIFQRSSSLAGFFYLFSLCLYTKSRLLAADGNRLSKWGPLYLFSWFLGVFAMLTKENTATLPLMIILLEVYFFKAVKPIRWKYIAPFLVLLPLVPLLLFYAKPATFTDVQTLMASPLDKGITYFLAQPRVLLTYIRLLFIPINQNLDYDYPITKSLLESPSLLSILALALILIGAVKLFHRQRLISFGIAWFFLTLLPESSVIPLDDVIFEHRLYLPMFGYGLFLVSAAYGLFGKNSFKLMTSALIAIVACYSVLTYNRNLAWKDELTLWNDTVLKSPQKARPYLNRGVAYFNKGNLDQAVSDYNKAITINPEYADAYNYRGNAYFKKGNLDQAVSDYNKAMTINPEHADAYNNRGVVYFNKGNLDQAISDYNKAIEIDPGYAEAYYNRGNAYFNKGNLDQAVSDYGKAIMINPEYGNAYYNRGNAYTDKGNLDQAVSDYNKAITINPNLADVYYNRGNAYFNKGNLDQAISDYNKAITINPEYADAYNNRGVAYFYKKDYDKAREDVHKAEGLGYKVNPQFIVELKRASGREK